MTGDSDVVESPVFLCEADVANTGEAEMAPQKLHPWILRVRIRRVRNKAEVMEGWLISPPEVLSRTPVIGPCRSRRSVL